MFIWGPDKDLAEKVSMAHSKSILSAISIAEGSELAVCFAHQPPVKEATGTSTGTGTQTHTGAQQQTQWRGGRQGAGRWGQGGGRHGQWRGGSGAGRGGRAPSVIATTQAGFGGPACFYCGDPRHFALQCLRKPNAAFQRGQGQG